MVRSESPISPSPPLRRASLLPPVSDPKLPTVVFAQYGPLVPASDRRLARVGAGQGASLGGPPGAGVNFWALVSVTGDVGQSAPRGARKEEHEETMAGVGVEEVGTGIEDIKRG